MIERALIYPAWILFRGLFLIFWYPALATGHVQAWLAAGIREARERSYL